MDKEKKKEIAEICLKKTQDEILAKENLLKSRQEEFDAFKLELENELDILKLQEELYKTSANY